MDKINYQNIPSIHAQKQYTIRDEKNKTNRVMIEDLYSLKPFGHGEGENNESE